MKRTALLVVLAAAAALMAAGGAQARLPQSARTLLYADHLEPHAHLRLADHTITYASHVLGFLRKNRSAGTRHSRAVVRRDSTWLLGVGRSHRASALDQLEQVEERRLLHGDWQTVAVPYADRIWPGTGGWLLACSSTGSEGGWGRFVMNTQGSGAGGWMQFMPGTFASNAPRAWAEARARGFRVPRAVMVWTSQAGQAVTAAYMRYHGHDSGQWSGYRC